MRRKRDLVLSPLQQIDPAVLPKYFSLKGEAWKMWRTAAILTLSASSLLLSPCATAQVPEIPNPQLNDIARVIPTPNGPVIEYNPIVCQQAGTLICGFFRTHEYGHVVLGHGYRSQWPQQMEAEADCWAAANASAAEVNAAYVFFQNGGGGTFVHGTGPQRAQRLLMCARR